MRNKERDVEIRKNKTNQEKVEFLEKILFEDNEDKRKEMQLVYGYAFRR